MKKIDLDDYEGFQRWIYIDPDGQDVFKVRVIINYHETPTHLFCDGQYSTIKEAIAAGEHFSEKEIDTHLRKKKLFEKCLKEKLNTDSETKNIELRDWGKTNEGTALSFYYNGERKIIIIPNLDDIDDRPYRDKVIEEAFHHIKQKLTRPE